MATQYTSILKLALPVQGELSGTWGDVVNDNITSMVEEAVAGRAVINTWTTNSHTLTTADGTTSESRCAMLEFTDTGAALTAAATVVCPSASKLYVCKNDAGQQVTIKTAAGTGVAIPDGQTMFVFCDGTNVEQCETNFNSLSYNGYTLNFGGAVTTAGAFTTSGAYALTLTTTGATNVTLPTTGTLATLDGTETLTNKTFTAPTITSPTLTGTISATDLNISGNTTIGDAAADTLTVNGTITSNLIFTDNTYDIGAVGATRPRNLYLSGDATMGGATLAGDLTVDTNTLHADSTNNRVGIGTASPLVPLDVLSDSNANAIRIRARAADDQGFLSFYSRDGLTRWAEIYGASTSSLIFSTGSSGTERMRIDSSGNVTIGSSDIGNAGTLNLSVGLAGTTPGGLQLWGATTGAHYVQFGDSTTSNGPYRGAVGYTHTSDALLFLTAGVEVARIDSSGSVLAGTTTAINSSHTFSKNQANNTVVIVNELTSGAPSGLQIRYSGQDPNNTGSHFLECYGTSGGLQLRASLRSNGGLANFQSNNVDLSDERTKTDITPAPSYWGKIGALEIVTYKYKDQIHDDINVGVIAQQVETVEPVWVDNDGFGETPEGEEPLKTVYTKDVTFAAIKALQEAMARIEVLEAEVAALKGA